MESLPRRARRRFADRTDAGHRLAAALAPVLAVRPVPPSVPAGTGGAVAPLVLGLCRGGMPVAAVLAADLGLEVDAVATRKLGAPGREELGFGALASCAGHRTHTTDPVLVDRLLGAGVTAAQLNGVLARERAALARQEDLFLAAPRSASDRTVVLVDDGVATGASMLAAVDAARAAGAARVVVAVPVSPPSTLDRIRRAADVVVCLDAPADFTAVGLSYRDFRQCTDADVLDILRGRTPAV